MDFRLSRRMLALAGVAAICVQSVGAAHRITPAFVRPSGLFSMNRDSSAGRVDRAARGIGNGVKMTLSETEKDSSLEMTTTVYTMKHPGMCTGMFWRDAPAPELKTNESGAKPAWPRNGAQLKGKVHMLKAPVQDNVKWLQVTEYCQAGSTKWEKTPNCWMQFEQGGLLLHESK